MVFRCVGEASCRFTDVFDGERKDRRGEDSTVIWGIHWVHRNQVYTSRGNSSIFHLSATCFHFLETEHEVAVPLGPRSSIT